MKLSILLLVLAGLALGALVVWFALPRHRHHDPIEYYKGWGGYWHPIGLENRMTKEEADAFAARGDAYLTGYFDEAGRLTRVVKMYRGELFFEYAYDYHPNGRLKRAQVSRGGQVTVLEYDTRGRARPGQRSAL